MKYLNKYLDLIVLFGVLFGLVAFVVTCPIK